MWDEILSCAYYVFLIGHYKQALFSDIYNELMKVENLNDVIIKLKGHLSVYLNKNKRKGFVSSENSTLVGEILSLKKNKNLVVPFESSIDILFDEKFTLTKKILENIADISNASTYTEFISKENLHFLREFFYNYKDKLLNEGNIEDWFYDAIEYFYSEEEQAIPIFIVDLFGL